MKLRNNLTGKAAFKSFVPSPIADYSFDVDSAQLQELAAAFAELKTALSPLSEKELKQLYRLEAKDSWRLSEETPLNPFSCVASADNENVDNIVRATVYGAEALEELPISTRLIRNLHYLICAGSDYDKKYRGEYRKSPVWIGAAGKGLAEATFIPPVPEDMDAAIADLENFVNYSEENVFVKAAVLHYQFEMIHPFIDGNGRIGRLMNNLFLMENSVIPAPALLLSHIIARGYNRYCEELQHVNETGDITTWLTYWLSTLKESAHYTLRVIETF